MAWGPDFDQVMRQRQAEADEFYAEPLAVCLAVSAQ